MKTNKLIILIITLISLSTLCPGQDKNVSKKDLSPNHENLTPDFKIIASNNSYIEIEYFPGYLNSKNDFYYSISANRPGEPNLKVRTFPVILPSPQNNKAEILDVRYTEEANIDIAPVPQMKPSNNKFEYLYDYTKNEKIYSTNEFFPKSFVTLNQDGIIRNKYFGNISISPIIYNPVSKFTRKLSYIRVRISFGKTPVISNKKSSNEEISFLYNIAINSKIALNWSTTEFNQVIPKIQNSVLANGDFYKIEVKETGIYKIDKNFLQQAGINVAGINPSTIKMYGNGGAELPYNNSISVPADLVENRIYVKTQNPNVFGDNDYILFYGKSPNDWQYNSISQKYTHYINHYNNNNIYWITFGNSNGLRMEELNSPNNSGLTPLQYYKEKLFEEPEILNLGSTGNLWLSQRIGVGESFNFNKELSGYVQTSDIELRLRYGNGSSSQARFLIKDDNSSLSVYRDVWGVPSSFSHITLDYVELFYQLFPNQNSTSLKLSLPTQYNNSGVSGYYDYIERFYNRYFNSVKNDVIRFSSPDTLSALEYQISPFTTSEIKIFNITDYDNVNIINPISYNAGVVRFQENSISGNPQQYIIAGGNNYKTPVSISSKVPNQNIHGIADGASFIIISPTEFLPAADRLKSQREISGPNYLKTIVLDINQVYNEFSGGLLDPLATRNFLKYAYNNWTEKPVYVLFLGDGSYDYKNIYNLGVKNFLPPYEKSTDDVNEILSYQSDDFLMDINENFNSPGENGIVGRPDFSTGRMCVNSLNEANIVIDKIIAYESPLTNDIWKKKIMYAADDGWTTENNQGQEGSKHTGQSEDLSESYTPRDFEKEKIYIVTYPTVITPQGRRKPGANIDIIKGWNEGRLVINWVGHGSTDLWAHEHIFVRGENIPQLNNKDKYPLVTIASCDLARWDDPFFVSAGEQLVFEANRGAIGVVGTVRPVYSDPNAFFNNLLWSNFMFLKDTLNLPIRIGKALYNTKNQLPSLQDNDAKFCLVGDPSLRVSLPEFFTRIDSINNISGNDTAIIKALQKVKISGSILKPDSTFWNDYNGEITLKVFDVDKNVVFVDFGYTFNFRLDGGTIFKGKSNVTNGKWQIEFIVPKDISYNTGNGKIIAYFKNSITQGSGYSNNFMLNGIDSNAAVDTLGPDISVYMGSRDFRTGDIISQNTTIIADFYDLSGINLTGTIGHKIEAIINDDENNKIDLTSYYNSTSGYQNGTLSYPLQGLSDGKYNLKIKAWDTYNNFSLKNIDFSVRNNTALVIDNVYNYPNPMKDNTTFMFNQNYDAPLNVNIKIFTVSGRVIKEINQNNISDKFVAINWDGKDNDGDYISNGTYLYKLTVKTTDGGNSSTITGKLAKLK